MSADVLRRAAALLRSQVQDLPVKFRDCWVQDSSEIHTVDLGEAGVPEWVDEVASYMVRMHPPVALALAGWLDREAARAEFLGDAHDGAEPLAVARAILREES